MLVGASLLSVVLLSLHMAQDAFHSKAGSVAAGIGNLTAILLLVLLLAGPALVPERRSGRIIMLFIALAALGMPALHFSLNGDRSRYSDALLFIWCLIVLGVNGGLSLLLWISELRRLRTERRTSA
jgi:hypothetical protein